MLQFWRKCKLFNNHCKLEHTIELPIKVTKNVCVCCQIHFFEQNTIGIGQQNCNHCIFTLRKIIPMRCMRYTGLIFWEWEHWCQLVLGEQMPELRPWSQYWSRKNISKTFMIVWLCSWYAHKFNLVPPFHFLINGCGLTVAALPTSKYQCSD